MFNYEEGDEPDHTREHPENMPLLDKMVMWIRNSGQDYPIRPNDDLFEGVKDDEDSTHENEISAYHNIIINSPAYKWFLTNLEKESTLQLETPHPRIRQQILDKLPTRTISKRQNPEIYKINFYHKWDYEMVDKLQHVLSEESGYLIQPYRPRIVMTGYSQEAQGLTIQQYLAQTWPSTGLHLLNALGKGINSLELSYSMPETPHGFTYHAYWFQCIPWTISN
jgi:hypothetical protein